MSSLPPVSLEPRFDTSFARWGGRVRRRFAYSRVLEGVAVGLVVGAVGAAVAWYMGHGGLRPWFAAAGVVGAGVGLLVARRRRLGDEAMALYLDGKLGSAEAITTARSASPSATGAHEVVMAQATAALEAATAEKVRPAFFRLSHALAPIGVAALAWASLAPLPPLPPPPPPPPGAEIVRLAEVSALDDVIRLADLKGRDPAEAERMKKLASDAEKLRAKLLAGTELREAQADLAKLREGVLAERLSLGQKESRAGLESAIAKMKENDSLKGAAKALGDRDLTSLDEEMRKLANKLERADREAAQRALEAAEEAAKKAGAGDVAKALKEQRELLAQQGDKADKLRELAKAMGDGLSPEAKDALGGLGQSGSPKSQQKLEKALGEALEKMTDEERKQLAENLKKQAEAMGEDGAPGEMSRDEMRQMAKDLQSPEGQRRLAEALKEMAKAPPPESAGGKRQQGLDDAERGMQSLDGQLGGKAPMPMPGGPGTGAPGGNPGSGPGDGDGSGPGGPGPGGGKGDHAGQTGVVDGDPLRAKATSRMNPGLPMPGTVLGRTTGRAGETANQVGQGGIDVARPVEVGGVERSDVPEEYREQVGRYFEPN